MECMVLFGYVFKGGSDHDMFPVFQNRCNNGNVPSRGRIHWPDCWFNPQIDDFINHSQNCVRASILKFAKFVALFSLWHVFQCSNFRWLQKYQQIYSRWNRGQWGQLLAKKLCLSLFTASLILTSWSMSSEWLIGLRFSFLFFLVETIFTITSDIPLQQ